jgi:uncharacterized protein (TIGR00299 family) protein
MTIAYLDCFSGISGDMFLGALLDAGLPFEELKRAIDSLPLEGYSIGHEKVMKNGLTATGFSVLVDEHHHEHRDFSDIERIINEGQLKDQVKEKSIQIFRSIAEVEGKIHNHPPEKVHFHEVGAVDSIIDIVGAAFSIDCLGIGSISSSRIPLGSGFIKSGHGRIPVPAPATISLLRCVPVYDSGLNRELVTPTGAALLKEFVSSFEGLPPMVVENVGYGAGSRDLPDRPNMLRIIIGSEKKGGQAETVVVLNANLDDTNPEWLGFIMEKLFKTGALDVAFFPIQMKKNRPGTQLEVIGRPQQKDELMDIIFRESSTLGIRFRYSERRVLERSQTNINSPWGELKVKKIVKPDGTSYIQPEYDSCKRIAEEKNIPLRDIYFWIISENRER